MLPDEVVNRKNCRSGGSISFSFLKEASLYDNGVEHYLGLDLVATLASFS